MDAAIRRILRDITVAGSRKTATASAYRRRLNWLDDKYSIFGEGSVMTSLADFGDSYALKGTAGCDSGKDGRRMNNQLDHDRPGESG